MPANRANIGWYIEEQLTDLDGKVAGKIYERQITVSAAEILALATTAKELVPAPGADRVLEFITAVIKYNKGETGYTESNGDMIIQYSGGQDVTASIASSTFYDHADNDEIRIAPFDLTAMAITTDLEVLKNTSLQLYHPTANPTLGDGTFDVRVIYRIHNFSN